MEKNDRWNLSLVKDVHVVDKKVTRNARKVAIYIVRLFMDQSLFKEWPIKFDRD